jgi:hypothetical protein
MNPSDASIFAVIFMAAYLPLTLMFDAVQSRQRAVLASILLAVMFMPWVSVDLGSYLVWNRRTSVTLAIFIGLILRDPERLTSLRLSRWDIPIITYCLIPLFSSVINGFGVYDGFSGIVNHSLWFGGPYFIGRIFFTKAEHRRDIARALVIGAAIYVPFCVWEIRMSPHLHANLYGFFQHEFQQTVRGNHYRPMVFMQHGLMVAMWIACGALMALCLHLNRDKMRFFGLSLRIVCVGLTLVLLAMQSYGAVILLLGFYFVVGYCRSTNHRWPLLLLLLVPLGWVAGRVTGIVDSRSLVEVMSFANERRSASFASRLHTEDVLIANTWKQPVFGLASWGADRTIEVEFVEKYVVVDGFWILAFSRYGFIGLLAFLLIFFLPAYSVLRRSRPRDWSTSPDHGVTAALALTLTIVAIDNLMNAMFNPLWVVIAGALVNLKGQPESEEVGAQHALESSGTYSHVLGQPRG